MSYCYKNSQLISISVLDSVFAIYKNLPIFYLKKMDNLKSSNLSLSNLHEKIVSNTILSNKCTKIKSYYTLKRSKLEYLIRDFYIMQRINLNLATNSEIARHLCSRGLDFNLVPKEHLVPLFLKEMFFPILKEQIERIINNVINDYSRINHLIIICKANSAFKEIDFNDFSHDPTVNGLLNKVNNIMEIIDKLLLTQDLNTIFDLFKMLILEDPEVILSYKDKNDYTSLECSRVFKKSLDNIISNTNNIINTEDAYDDKIIHYKQIGINIIDNGSESSKNYNFIKSKIVVLKKNLSQVQSDLMKIRLGIWKSNNNSSISTITDMI
jgi:hypothetical protein